MPESELIIMLDNDEETLNNKDRGGSTSPKTKRTRLTFPFGACRVCADSATGIHYGIATCEGCKGFFKRSILRKEKYRCYFDNSCLINVTNRNRCKACRFRRCIDEGMSVDGVKMGRIPKLVKERALKELKEQQMKEEAALTESDEAHPRTASCSSTSDRSIENYDPNTMEIDFIQSDHSPIQRTGDLTHTYTDDNLKKSVPVIIHSKEIESSNMLYRTKYPTFLPPDFTVDESDGLTEQTTDLFKDEVFEHVNSIAKKLNANQSNFSVVLNDDETRFIRYLCYASHSTFLRRSKRLKQSISRMNQIIEKNIQEFPGDNASEAELFNSVRLACEVYTPATVHYIQELPGMKNINLKSLEKMIGHRTFDWHLIKHHELYKNGQSYYLAPNGFQFTRFWMDRLHGSELSDSIFHFTQCFHDLNLRESEIALVIPFQTCYDDASMEDQKLIQMLRACYSHALYTELRQNRGENEARIMYKKIRRTLELLIPLNDLYQSKLASRTFAV